MLAVSTLSTLHSTPSISFWRDAFKFLVEFVIGEGLETLIESAITRSRKEISDYRASAYLLSSSNMRERTEILNSSDRADAALRRLEDYIRAHRNEHEKINSFLRRLYKEELSPLANRMDAVETRINTLSRWREQQEKRQRDWDRWRESITQIVVTLKHDIVQTKDELEKTKKELNKTKNDLETTTTELENLKKRLRRRIIFNAYYQRLDIFADFWERQFNNTPIAQYNNEEYKGVGGDLGISFAGFFRAGGGTHFMMEQATNGKASNELGGGLEDYTLKVSGTGYQAYALVAIPIWKFGLEGGGGYYWVNYNINGRTKGLRSSRNLKNGGAYAIGTLTLGSDRFKIFGEANLAVKPDQTFAFIYKRVGLRFSFPF